ncbi:MAG: Spx/MgsR family RNA polymerase-binding regulatory protein [Chthoniobacterales bacterium]
MKKLKVYLYRNCDGCRRAVKWLRERGVGFEEIPVRESPPEPAELRAALEAVGGNRRRLFNVAGRDYRAMGLSEKLGALSEDEAIDLLAGNGSLVKRPFVIEDGGEGVVLVGFDAGEWGRALGVAGGG